MDYRLFSKNYTVRPLHEEDVEDIFNLCSRNSLYYTHCPPFITREGVLADMHGLPPNKEQSDKYYVGFFDAEQLIAVLDLIKDYPEADTAYVGFFMTEITLQKRGIGSGIVGELFDYLAQAGFAKVRLGWMKGNPQAEHFWKKNGFVPVQEVPGDRGAYVVVAERPLRIDRAL